MPNSHIGVADDHGIDVGEVDDGRPVATDAPGVYLYPGSFETIIGLLRQGITAMAAAEPFRRLAIPPVISRRTIEHAGYVKTFPQLLGTVHSYRGDSRTWGKLAPLVEQGGEWYAEQQISDLVLLPAACYPVYDTLTGQTLDGPRKFHVEATCFRQEATSETGRLRSFRMVELVTAATEEYCIAYRSRWLERVAGWFKTLGLEVRIEVADDPFFGPGKKLFQAAQRMQELKYELKVPVSDDLVQAVASANFHKDHFGEAFDFTVDGAVGNTSCMAFGMERIALALINAHGPHAERWPADVLAAIGGGSDD
ncbi:MAG TPA: aminoacyl--tRNA ligase-related protein [Pseudonocardiaceae bacterium]|jgi:seryl-tRNA synthetase|nr:aminoacyl--tRNA ligase-related protein [Pseudonocardiaceae bacterium]